MGVDNGKLNVLNQFGCSIARVNQNLLGSYIYMFIVDELSPVSQQGGSSESQSLGAAPTEHWHSSYSVVCYCTGFLCSLQLVWGRQENLSAWLGGTQVGGQGSYRRPTIAMQ